ncbi:MAG: nicotinate-nucleotide--dimethylbenzimidazole phosphoribosyltransferase [Synergistaceae bacterium]|nr:nicotinate-nucleotide--dimethylbenzimidazole phosphoribosyltransferase [Synergistaceae bacterium]
MNLQEILRSITKPDSNAMLQAKNLLESFVKPQGSLGHLENIAIRVSGITGKPRNTLTRKAIFLFGSDHGIYSEGVCSSPQDFTRKLMRVYAETQDGGINVLARQAGADLRIYDLGVKELVPHKNIITRKFLPEGTANFLHGRAMPLTLTEEVILFGAELVHQAKLEGVSLIGTGEVGMGNTTPACACIMAGTGSRDASLVGRGAGLDDEAFARKQRVILEALALHSESLTDPVNILSCVGGLDIAAMTGVFLGGAAYHVPVIIDGVISIAGALMAYMLEPITREYMFASHESPEPAYSRAAKFMNLEAPLKLGMRLGEGTGCAIMMNIIDNALAIINGMGNFDELL